MSGPGALPANPPLALSAATGFKHHWQATVLTRRPLILPRRRYVYPRHAEEIERGALEVLVTPTAPNEGPPLPPAEDAEREPFLATCALGFADPLAPTGLWSCPNPDQLCAVAGGYAYLIDTQRPDRFEHLPYRPVLAIHAAREAGRLLFLGSRRILAYGLAGRAWESPRLSDEGITLTSIDATHLYGTGWLLATDTEFAFKIALSSGELV